MRKEKLNSNLKNATVSQDRQDHIIAVVAVYVVGHVTTDDVPLT